LIFRGSAKPYGVRPASAAVGAFENAAGRRSDAAWDGHPSASYAWTRAAARMAPHHLWMVLGEPEAPLAVLTMRSRIRSTLLFPVGHHHGGFQPLNGHAPQTTAAVLARLSQRYAAYLPFCSGDLASAVVELSAACRIREHDTAPFVQCEDPETYLSGRPRKLRATIRRAEQAFGEIGGVIERISQVGVEDALEKISAVEAAGHRTVGRIFIGHHSSFLRTAFSEFQAEGVLELWVARIGQCYTGYLVAFRAPKSTYFYTTGITADMAEISLGSAVFHRAIAYNLAQGRQIDLGTGRTPFKSRFATGERQLYDVLMIPRRNAIGWFGRCSPGCRSEAPTP
jgi:CelD/BcsL family acetyltransferase involved in cellulose biosynthesis